jgi:hypothetical protein
VSVFQLYDYRGRAYTVIDSIEIPEFKGDGGLHAFARTDVNIKINDLYTMSFALTTKTPIFLYVNGWPALPEVLYNPVLLTDGYWYGFYFEKLVYNEKELRPGEVVPVRTMVARIARCLS